MAPTTVNGSKKKPSQKPNFQPISTDQNNRIPSNPPITTKMGTLNYKEAARQVRAIEAENATLTAQCYPNSSSKSKQPRPRQIKPAITEIRAPELPTSYKRILDTKHVRKEKCPELSSVSTMSSTANIRNNVSCVQTEVLKSSSSTSTRSKAVAPESCGSNYQNWTYTVPLCFKSDSDMSSRGERSKTKFAAQNLQQKSSKSEQTRSSVSSRDATDVRHMSTEGGQQRVGGNWKRPCAASVVAGAPQRYTGTCPPTLEQIAKMSEARKKFFLTQDPRRIQCLINPDYLRSKTISQHLEFKTFTEMVKVSENVCKGKEIQTQDESVICETIDMDNPLNLDFQGLDYKNTYQSDEQDFQNIRLYRHLCRHMDRKRTKLQTKEEVEEELQKERLGIPKCFDVPDQSQIVIEPSDEEIAFGRLYRATEKPYNKKRIENELQTRKQRYKDLYLKLKAREEEQHKEQAEAAEAAEQLLGATVATKHFEEAIERLHDDIILTVVGEQVCKREEVKRTKYPHTIRETHAFKQKLAKEQRIEHDKAVVKQEFYMERLGKQKDYPGLHLKVGKDRQECEYEAVDNSQTESSDDEDDLQVGKVGSNFKLRGFHFKLGNELRGMLHEREKFTGARKGKGCITREQWLKELVPRKRQVKMDVVVGVLNLRNPDDPNFELFPPERGFRLPKIRSSAVRQFIAQPLGRHYDRSVSIKLKTRMPRLAHHVKKFNLIRFLYSENDRRLEALRAEELSKDLATFQPLTSTLDYIVDNDTQRQERKELEKRKRMQLLGIPCIEPNVKHSQDNCNGSDTDTDSDWVPEREPDVEGSLSDYEVRMKAEQTNENLSTDKVTNMPAPEFRESTLRRHPRHGRDYNHLRVPSALFDEAVKTSGIPHLYKLDPEQRLYENVRLPKRTYTRLFEARHHHDHSHPVQNTTVDVHYQPKIIHAEATKEPLTMNEEQALKVSFEKALPECMQYVDQDLTDFQCDIEGMLKQHRNERKKTEREGAKDLVKDTCQCQEIRYHSRDPKELENLNYPGRKAYLDFLSEIRNAFQEKKTAIDDAESEDPLCIDRREYIEELEKDLKSIESCLTSVSSSLCTNLTNDSGSFLLMEGVTKVPLDYIRKSVVPFEELQRSRFKAVPIDCEAEEANPFRVMPFSGQKRVQIMLSSPKDSFFTFTTRLRNGLRLRLETPVVDISKTLIGRGARKYPGAVATDIDESYVNELKNRPAGKSFKFKSGRDYVKNALRLKFESMVIQGQMVRAKIYDRLNEQHWQAMQKIKQLYEKLFLKWGKREYDTAMSVVHKVKVFYEITDELRFDFRELERQQLMLNMDIVFIEGVWISRVMLQNFHYLLGDSEWRCENDWIHRIQIGEDENGEPIYDLEGYEQSIAKRSKVNVRNREKDDAWAIKAYYEDVYLPNKQPILIVFPDAKSFLNGIENLKLKTFMLLLELHFTMSVNTDLKGKLATFEECCMYELKEKEDYVKRKCSKKYFMEDRAAELRRRTLDFLDEPFENCFNDANHNRDRAVISEVWRQIVPATQRGAGNQDIEPCDMVAMMSDEVVNLIAEFENIPMEESKAIEARLRRHRAYLRKLSRNAYQTECRINLEMKKVRRNLEPPYKKPDKPIKPKRTYLKKIEKPPAVQEVHISEHTKFFFRAFHETGDVMQAADARDSIMEVNTMQDQIVPFYFDHFLKLNGYNANYNFKTQIEMRDGPEIERLQVKALLPEVMEKIDKWEIQRKKIRADNIARNPKMYENVNF